MARTIDLETGKETGSIVERQLARANKKFLKTVKDLDDFDIRKTLDVNEYMRGTKIKEMKKKKYD